jgi:hypothetical protein
MAPTPLSDEEINSQHVLLATHHRTLAFLLTQLAAHGGEAYAPPIVLNSIYEARENIRRIKNTLRESGIEVADRADDEPTPYGATLVTGEAPFKGLLHFDEEDAHLFFGRESLTAKLVGQLRSQHFLAVVGASGSGKSSVVQAGLIPALRRSEPLADGSLPPASSTTWPTHAITPTAHPLEALAASLTRESESVTVTATLIDDLAHDSRSLHLAVRKLLSRGPIQGAANRLLLVVDQFEEIFTLCRDDAERTAFVDNLINATSPATDGPTVVVIVLRADFYQACGKFANLREVLEKCQVYIGAMRAEERRRAPLGDLIR